MGRPPWGCRGTGEGPRPEPEGVDFRARVEGAGLKRGRKRQGLRASHLDSESHWEVVQNMCIGLCPWFPAQSP